ncbi:MAG: hypothetical protein J6X31_01105 [Bacteroidales bacterium]|nr:hypothetical protein [Bacteroidales bacterium]
MNISKKILLVACALMLPVTTLWANPTELDVEEQPAELESSLPEPDSYYKSHYKQSLLSGKPLQEIVEESDGFYYYKNWYNTNRDYERLVDRYYHLRGWGKFCNIYGVINMALGGFLITSGFYQDQSQPKVVGVMGLAEGLGVLLVGRSLEVQCKETHKEVMRINNLGVPAADIQLNKDVRMVPSVNLLSDRTSLQRVLGMGLTVKF